MVYVGVDAPTTSKGWHGYTLPFSDYYKRHLLFVYITKSALHDLLMVDRAPSRRRLLNDNWNKFTNDGR